MFLKTTKKQIVQFFRETISFFLSRQIQIIFRKSINVRWPKNLLKAKGEGRCYEKAMILKNFYNQDTHISILKYGAS